MAKIKTDWWSFTNKVIYAAIFVTIVFAFTIKIDQMAFEEPLRPEERGDVITLAPPNGEIAELTVPINIEEVINTENLTVNTS